MIDTCGTQLSKLIKGVIIYVGIDVAKNTRVAVAINSDGQVLIQPFSFANSATGFSLLKEKLEICQDSNLLLGLESTAHYGENLIYFLCNHNYRVAMINPIQTSALRKSNIRKTKTDKVDPLLIAKSLMINHFNILEKNRHSTSKTKSYL